MKKTNNYLLILPLVFIFWTCGNSNQTHQELPDFMKILPGIWYNENSGTYEEWRYQDGNLFGKSYKIAEADTIITESLKLFKNNLTYVYEATVIGQNDNNPILFKLSSEIKNKIVFINPDHDFPQKIVYHFINDNTMEVFVSEMAEDLEKGFTLKFVKINNL
jgi:hypothetical protein